MVLVKMPQSKMSLRWSMLCLQQKQSPRKLTLYHWKIRLMLLALHTTSCLMTRKLPLMLLLWRNWLRWKLKFLSWNPMIRKQNLPMQCRLLLMLSMICLQQKQSPRKPTLHHWKLWLLLPALHTMHCLRNRKSLLTLLFWRNWLRWKLKFLSWNPASRKLHLLKQYRMSSRKSMLRLNRSTTQQKLSLQPMELLSLKHTLPCSRTSTLQTMQSSKPSLTKKQLMSRMKISQLWQTKKLLNSLMHARYLKMPKQNTWAKVSPTHSLLQDRHTMHLLKPTDHR